MGKKKAQKIEIRPVPRKCKGCVMRGSELCPLCATLVADEEGQCYVSLRPLDGDNGWRTMDMQDLTAAPRMLLVE